MAMIWATVVQLPKLGKAFPDFMKAPRSAKDFDGCFGLHCYAYDSEDSEKLLMPPSGPAAADELMVDMSDEESFSDWEGEEEEDFDDDEF